MLKEAFIVRPQVGEGRDIKQYRDPSICPSVVPTRGVHGDGEAGKIREIRGFPAGVGMNVAGIPRGWI